MTWEGNAGRTALLVFAFHHDFFLKVGDIRAEGRFVDRKERRRDCWRKLFEAMEEMSSKD